MILAGLDLAWQSHKNPSALAYGKLVDRTLYVNGIFTSLYGIDSLWKSLREIQGLHGIAIDAPLIIRNNSGQRECEKEIGRIYGKKKACCHAANTKLYPDAESVYLSKQILAAGFKHLKGSHWQIECYTHPAIIEIFNLDKRLKYKKGTVAEKQSGQKELASLLQRLTKSRELKLITAIEYSRILDDSYIGSLRGKALKNNEDALDSLICLYIAGLYALNQNGKVFGNAISGYIWVPQGVCV
jgi:predicted RNase H-like nuclease